MLTEKSAKVLSIIIAKRLLHRLKQIRTKAQFNHASCQEAQHILKRALLLCAILKKYGLWPALVQNIAKLYKNCKVRIKLGRDCMEVDCTMGVHQGDNMSPVLFLFVIQPFLHTLKLKNQPGNFAYFPENKNGRAEMGKGRLLNQSTFANGVAYNL